MKNNELKYWKKICKQAHDFWAWDETLVFFERKYFYDLMMYSKNEIRKIKNEL